jgi:hypothetical protein
LMPCPPDEKQDKPSTSKDSKTVFGHPRKPSTNVRSKLVMVGDLYGEPCSCGTGLARHDSGLCELCTAAKARRS